MSIPTTPLTGNLAYTPFTGGIRYESGAIWSYTTPFGVYEGGRITTDSGLDIHIAAGAGYLGKGTYPNHQAAKISWVDSVMTLDASSTHYIFADIDGLDSGTVLPDSTTTILLGRVRTHAAGVEFIDNQRVCNYHPFQSNICIHRDIFGPLFKSGSTVSANASRELAISAGVYYYLNNKYSPSGRVSPAGLTAYYHSGGVWNRTVQTIVGIQYDNMTDLVALPTGKFTKHTLYLVSDGVNEQYLLVYGQTLFDTLGSAQEGALVTPPNYFTEGVVAIASLIVQEGVTNIVEIMNIRPVLGVSNGNGTTSQHGNLLGLGDDDHTQYLLASGARSMSGDLNMGSNNIITSGLVGGVNAGSHSSRHLPAGADALSTAAAVGLGSSSVNGVGVANSFARSDHTHALDMSGFSLNSLVGPIDVNHGGTGASSLTSGRFLIGNGTSVVDLSKVAPSGIIVGATDVQTLTNKTINDATNDVSANKLRGINVSSGAPSDAQVLTYSSSSSAWVPAAAAVSVSGTLASQQWMIKDIKSVGVNGGSITANTWTQRSLNTLVGAGSEVTLASDQITFAAGTYRIQASVPGRGIAFHKAKLRNITDSTDIAYGTSAFSAVDSSSSLSIIDEQVTFAGSKVVQIQHFCTRSQATDGLGVATGIAGTNEIYTTICVEKLN